MITEIPSVLEFQEAGLNQIYLAWQIAIQTTQEHEQAQEAAIDLEKLEAEAAKEDYWKKSQPVLANAFALVQQAMEMALKARIAAISPYLLISRDPKDWPSGVDRRPVSFSDFRTLDAADLFKLHNTFAKKPLNDEFRSFWDGLRRERNRSMHSVSNHLFDTAILIRSILVAVESLFCEASWPQQLLKMEAEGKYAAYGLGVDDDQNIVMGQIDTAIRHLSPADSKRFFGFDPKRNSYVCPVCWHRANRDWQALAQLKSKQAGETSLICVVCEEHTIIDRIRCINPDCDGSVIYEEKCMLCMWDQDSPDNFPSGLQNDDLSLEHVYSFTFRRITGIRFSEGRFPDAETAIEHIRRSMNATYLQSWDLTTIHKGRSGLHERIVGSWFRMADRLIWYPDAGPESFNLHDK